MRALLFSGGVDSTCLASMTKPDLALTIDYGQVCAKGEIRAARQISSILGVSHRVIEVPLRHLGSGEMIGDADSFNKGHIPEHWPFRNQMLLTIAAMALANQNLNELIIGTVATDYEHNDGTQAFLDAMNNVLQIQLGEFNLTAPASSITSQELVKKSGIRRDLLGWTFSCHRSEIACGICRGCNKSLNVLSDLV